MARFPKTDERKNKMKQMDDAGRLPPRQALTEKWPVLHFGDVPEVDLSSWELKVDGLVEESMTWNWDEFQMLPKSRLTSDIHCVTRWSKFDNEWDGVTYREFKTHFKVLPTATHVMVHGYPDFTTNLPISALDDDDVILATHHNGEPLTAPHGGPLRLVVPKLYFWKSAKWLKGFTFMAEDRPGFWESHGYHMHGDPFKEERLWDD